MILLIDAYPPLRKTNNHCLETAVEGYYLAVVISDYNKRTGIRQTEIG